MVDLLQLFCHWKTIRPQLSTLLSFVPKHFLIFVDVVYAGCDSLLGEEWLRKLISIAEGKPKPQYSLSLHSVILSVNDRVSARLEFQNISFFE